MRDGRFRLSTRAKLGQADASREIAIPSNAGPPAGIPYT